MLELWGQHELTSETKETHLRVIDARELLGQLELAQELFNESPVLGPEHEAASEVLNCVATFPDELDDLAESVHCAIAVWTVNVSGLWSCGTGVGESFSFF